LEIEDTQDLVAERIGKFLRSRQPTTNPTGWRAKNAEKVGASEDAFYTWLMGDTAPQLHHSVKLAAVFGGEFLDAVYGIAGLEAFPIGSETGRRELENQITSLASELETMAAELRAKSAPAGVKLRAV